jgi:hypothetical protein
MMLAGDDFVWDGKVHGDACALYACALYVPSITILLVIGKIAMLSLVAR